MNAGASIHAAGSLVRAERIAQLTREGIAIAGEISDGHNSERDLAELHRRQNAIADALRALDAWPPKVPQ